MLHIKNGSEPICGDICGYTKRCRVVRNGFASEECLIGSIAFPNEECAATYGEPRQSELVKEFVVGEADGCVALL